MRPQYDAWGLTLPIGVNGDNRFTFNGKEKQEGTNWISLGWREYSPETGRMNSIDGASELNISNSGYSIAANNTINFVDAEGSFKIDAQFARKYPTLAKLIGHFLPQLANNPNVKRAIMSQFGYQNEADFINDFTFGSGPWITPTDPSGANIFEQRSPFHDKSNSYNSSWGNGLYKENLFLSESNAYQLELSFQNQDVSVLAAQMFKVSLSILHEYAHYLAVKN